MKPKHLFLATVLLLAALGVWLAWTAWRADAFDKLSTGPTLKSNGLNSDPNSPASLAIDSQMNSTPGPSNRPPLGQALDSSAHLAPPEPTRRFTDFTPEQRVQFARQGHGPGG